MDAFATSLARHVDEAWYLKTYPDVAAANADARRHYVQHGRYENRLPRDLVAVRAERELWEGDTLAGAEELRQLLADPRAGSAEACFAAWALARWHGSFGRWHEAQVALQVLESRPLGSELVPHLGPVLLACVASRKTGALVDAQERLAVELSGRGRLPDLLLEGASQAGPIGAVAWINELFEEAGLSPVVSTDVGGKVSLDTLGSGTKDGTWAAAFRSLAAVVRPMPLVSVIVPGYNAQRSLATALRCIREQTWRNLEIIVVDDASEDASAAVAEAAASQDSRIRLARHDANQGTYAARNTGLTIAKGEFLTVHDSDDWSHPEKIERQVRALVADRDRQASLSHWSRCTPTLCFGRDRMEEGFVHPNLSSLMIRRTVFESLGFWDRVSVAADTEYYHRILRAFGKGSVVEVMPGVPLSFGRHDSNSLTLAGNTHWSTLFKGVRRDYIEAALRWHDDACNTKDLYLDARPVRRPFPAPPGICR